MKKVVHGVSGSGKSHLILHSISTKRKVVLITTNGLESELKNVGLQDMLVEKISLTVMNREKDKNAKIVVCEDNKINPIDFDKIGFDLALIPSIYNESSIDAVVEWLDKTGISNDTGCVIVFISIPKKLNNIPFVKKVENWAADVIIEHQDCNDLEHIRKSDKWEITPVERIK